MGNALGKSFSFEVIGEFFQKILSAFYARKSRCKNTVCVRGLSKPGPASSDGKAFASLKALLKGPKQRLAGIFSRGIFSINM